MKRCRKNSAGPSEIKSGDTIPLNDTALTDGMAVTIPKGEPPMPKIAVPAINMFIDSALQAIAAPATPKAKGTTMNHF